MPFKRTFSITIGSLEGNRGIFSTDQICGSLIKLYINTELLNERDNKKEFVAAARTLITQDLINSMVQQTEGFSHANIQDMIKSMRDAARATKDGILRANHINNAINRALNDYKIAQENKRMREQKFAVPPA